MEAPDAIGDRYYVALGAAFVRGRVPELASPQPPDDGGPAHTAIFRAGIGRLFEDAGARRVNVEHVLNHIVVLALIA